MTSSLVQPPAASRLLEIVAATASDQSLDDSVLLAWATLDPAAACQWLLDAPAALALQDSRSRLARIVETLAASVERSSGGIPGHDALRLLERHGHLLGANAASMLVASLDTGLPAAHREAALSAVLERSPDNAIFLRAASEMAVAARDDARAHELLTRIGRRDRSLASMRYVLGARRRLAPTADPRVRIALASSFTVDALVPYIDLECRLLRLEPELYLSPFNTWEREMLGGDSALERFDPQIVFLAISLDDLVPGAVAGTATEIAEAGAAAVDRLLTAVARFVAWSPAMLVVHGLHTVFADPLGPAAGRAGPSRIEVVARLNLRLAEALRELPNTYFLDLADVFTRRSGGPLDNPKLRHLASMRLNEHVLGDVARSYARFIAPLTGRTRKCIVLDLDNTLWGGIVGEDGPNGVRLGNTSPGSEFRELQQYLLALSRRGMLLAINSKNNEADALEVIRGHDAMVLREDSFSAMRINWERKPDNMVSLAQELNIGLDSLVFVDDNEKEREHMRQALPQVLTPELPRDPARYRGTLEDLPELQVLTVTEEDRTRTQQYAERRQREHLRVESQTPERYLESLAIVVEMGLASPKTLPRVHQLFQRTNQFNLTARRYELGRLADLMGDPGWRLYTSQVSDRFGDHGLVAAALARVDGDAWRIENLVMSCRVIGYGVEDALLARVMEDARLSHARRLAGEVIATPKNAPARDFYGRNGFMRTEDAGEIGRWERELSTPTAAPAWITMRTGDGA